MWDIRGGRLAELPRPYCRYFDDKRRKRHCAVEVTQYWGAGHHYYVKVWEEDNPIRTVDGKWQLAFDDKVGRGQVFEKRFSNIVDAQRFADKTIKKYFPNHRKADVKLLGQVTRKTWFYREGD